MGFFHGLKDRFAEAVHHRAPRVDDPVLGCMEYEGDGLWRTCEAIALREDGGRLGSVTRDAQVEPIEVVVEGDLNGPSAEGRAAFEELRRRYDDLKAEVGALLHTADVRGAGHFGAKTGAAARLWEQAMLSGIEILRDPTTGHLVLGLAYQLDDTPEYTYVVRVENWHAVDVLVTG